MDIDRITRNSCKYIGNGMYKNIFSNPVYVSITITLIILLIIITVYDSNSITKTGVYVFLSTLFVVFIHNSILLNEYAEQASNNDLVNLCSPISEDSVVVATESNFTNTTGGFNF